MAKKCGLTKKSLGVGECAAMPGYFKKILWTPLSWFIPAATIAQGDAAVITFIQNALTAGTIHLFPTLFSLEDQSTDSVKQTTVLGTRQVAPGFYQWLINFSNGLCFHKALRTFETTTGRLIIQDVKGQWLGTDPAGTGDFYGQTLQMLQPEKMKSNTGTEVAMSPLTIVLEDNLEFDQYGVILTVAGFNTLVELTDVSISIDDADAGTLEVEVVIDCDGTALLGLTEDDFVNLDSDGVPAAITGLTDNGDGSYSLVGTFETGGTISLVPAPALSVEGYNILAPAVITLGS